MLDTQRSPLAQLSGGFCQWGDSDSEEPLTLERHIEGSRGKRKSSNYSGVCASLARKKKRGIVGGDGCQSRMTAAQVCYHQISQLPHNGSGGNNSEKSEGVRQTRNYGGHETADRQACVTTARCSHSVVELYEKDSQLNSNWGGKFINYVNHLRFCLAKITSI